MGFLAEMLEADFKGRKSRPIEVAEWGKTLHIFPLTIGELADIDAEPDKYRRSIRIIVTRGRNEDGSPMFDESDYRNMLVRSGVGRGKLDIIGPLSQEIMRDTDTPADEDIEGREKN